MRDKGRRKAIRMVGGAREGSWDLGVGQRIGGKGWQGEG